MPRILALNKCGQAIRHIRQEAGLSQEALANRIGWDKSRLSRYENNHTSLSLSALTEISRALQTDSLRLLLECVKQCYPALRAPDSRAGRLLDDLIEQLVREGEGRNKP